MNDACMGYGNCGRCRGSHRRGYLDSSRRRRLGPHALTMPHHHGGKHAAAADAHTEDRRSHVDEEHSGRAPTVDVVLAVGLFVRLALVAEADVVLRRTNSENRQGKERRKSGWHTVGRGKGAGLAAGWDGSIFDCRRGFECALTHVGHHESVHPPLRLSSQWRLPQHLSQSLYGMLQ